MDRFKCLGCDQVIHAEDLISKNGEPIELPILNTNDFECPHCNNDDLVEVMECLQCSEYFTEDELDAEQLCKECAGEKEVEVEFVISVNVTYKGKFPYKMIRDYHGETEGNPLATKEIHEEVRKQVAEGNYCITDYTWEEV